MLAHKELLTVSDLLYYAPFRYEDRRNLKTIASLAPGEKAAVLATVARAKMSGFRRRSLGLFEATLEDDSGVTLTARWFHGERYADSLVPGVRLALFGKVELDRSRGNLLIVQPEIEFFTEEDHDELLHTGRIVAIYEAAGKISTRVFRTLIDRVLREAPLPQDPLPESTRLRAGLPQLGDAVRELHVPPPDASLELLNAFRTPAQTRLIFDEFFWLECGLALKRSKARVATGISFPVSETVRSQIKQILPFKPTGAQRRVMQEIAEDMKQPHPMNRLLQGDVGSGKTVVAAEAAVVALANGYQVAVLAPTEILAFQHLSYFQRLLSKLSYVLVALTGAATTKEKQSVKALLNTGMAHMVVGTHALLEESVTFSKLGLVVIDEQHRFGVRQRLALMKKGPEPDVLVMTATPIPRTLALTVYGDLDISTLDELPPGRQPITTKAVPEAQSERVYSFLAREVKAGRQAYIVYPLVEETETSTEVKAAETMYEHLRQIVFPTFAVGLLHGKMPTDDKEAVMRRFKSGEIDILVATTVIEVGVDVPNASVMVIEQAERFGLAQIHQLRGRVGRGIHKSYCILVTGKLNDVARERIRTLVESNDGFYISEMDMKLRGPGEFYGTRQSGIPGLRLADLVRDSEILEQARSEAEFFLETQKGSSALLAAVRYIQENWQRKYGLAQVG
jgi:ATP-dependent DNA helicase RecG